MNKEINGREKRTGILKKEKKPQKLEIKNLANFYLEMYDYSVFSPKADNYSRNELRKTLQGAVWTTTGQAWGLQDQNRSGKKPPTGKSRPKFPSSAPPPPLPGPEQEAVDRRTRPSVTAFSRPARLTQEGGDSPAAPPLTRLLPGAKAANQRPPPAPAGLWTRHGNFLLFGEYTVQCSMSVSAAAQRNSHFVTELDVHQDARASESCSLRQLPSCPLISSSEYQWEHGERDVLIFRISIHLFPAFLKIRFL